MSPHHRWPEDNLTDPEPRLEEPPKLQDPVTKGYIPKQPVPRNRHQKGKELPDLTKAGGRLRQTGSRLREIRASLGMTQMALAVAADTSLEVIRKAERGYLLQLKTATIIRLAASLNCGAADIFPVLGERLNRI